MTNALPKQATILEFLYELNQKTSDFPPHISHLLYTHFGFENIGFLSFVEENEKTLTSKEVLEYTYALVNSDIYVQQYNKHFYSMDSMTYNKLPPKLRNQNIVHYSQIPHHIHEKPYKEFKDSLSLRYSLCMYLFNENNSYLGRIALVKTKEAGNFTKMELQIISTIYKHVSNRYANFIESCAIARKLDIMNNCINNLPLGTILFDSKFVVVTSNNAASEYCSEILEFQNNDKSEALIKNSKYKDQQQVIHLVFDSLSIIQNNIETVFNTYYATYNINIICCITRNKHNSIDTLYFMYISKQVNSEVGNLENFAQKYNLTSQELNIIHLVKEGWSTTEISEKLYISKNTAKSHFTNIYRKLNVTDRVSLLHKISGTTRQSSCGRSL